MTGTLGHFVHGGALATRGTESAKPLLAGHVAYTGAAASGRVRVWGSLAALALLALCASRVLIDHNAPFCAFSSHFHFPKSIYEGNFGCGYLKERRASGLVFCENTASVYRALFVSSPVFSSFCFNGDCENVDWNF